MSEVLTETVKTLVRRVDRVETQLAEHAERHGNHETRISVMEATITRLSDDTALIRDDLKDNNTMTLAAAEAAQDTKVAIETATKVLGAVIALATLIVSVIALQ